MMRKAALALGLGYVLWGLWQLLSAIRVATLFRKFSANIPFTTFLLPIGILSYGVIQFVGYFINFQNKKVYSVLFILGLIFIAFGVANVLLGGFIANKRIEMILDEAGYSGDRL